MEEQPRPRMILPPVEQIGIVVKDLDRAIEYYSSIFGWGPFRVQQFETKRFTYRGQTGPMKMKVGFAQSGPIEIELIQVLDGETPWTEFLREKGEGLHHLRFRVDDLDGMLSELAEEGIEPAFRGTRFAYLNSDKIGGVIFELSTSLSLGARLRR